ncbi:addiction module protein [Marinospirillum sp.]|uniref:addiction module protein n=1 Tax=Marinospirillum sp. TaxID=2183934 RepID=UPI0028702708|nr:addiction module protein [Marinospirillum sp.]MDR9469429.1 addiction module protein [Marinospirillum sp.]
MKSTFSSEIVEISETIEIPEWHKRELEKRLEAYHTNPEVGSPWQAYSCTNFQESAPESGQ